MVLRLIARPGGWYYHFGRFALEQLLVQGGRALALGDAELTGAHVSDGQGPAGAFQHHGTEPVVAAGGKQTLFDHGAGGEHPGHLAFEQGSLGGCGFDLVAEGDAEPAPHQFAAVPLGCMVGDAGHRHSADRLAGVLAGEGELQQP